MSQTNAIRLQWETERAIGFVDILAGFSAIGTAFTNEMRQVIIQNQTDVDLEFSFDGVNAHLTLYPGDKYAGDFTANKSTPAGFFLPVNTIVYVRRGGAGAPTTGAVYVAAFYGAN